MKKVLVTGAAGNIGLKTCSLLASRDDIDLHALVRDPKKSTVFGSASLTSHVGDLADMDAMKVAMQGVDTVILITPASAEAANQAHTALEAAKYAKVKKIIRISALKASESGPTNNTRLHAITDKEVMEANVNYVVLRPNIFMQNLFLVAQSISAQRRFSFGMHATAAMGMIDTRDVAACAAKCVVDEAHDNQIIELTGPDAITYQDVANAITHSLEKSVKYEPVSPDEVYRSIVDAGWGEWLAGITRDYANAYNEGWGAYTTDGVERITGRSPKSITTFIEEEFLAGIR